MRWWDGAAWAADTSPDTSEEWHGAEDHDHRRSPSPPAPAASHENGRRDGTRLRPMPEPRTRQVRDGQKVRMQGLARAVQQRTVGTKPPVEILQFRIERYDASGNRLPRVQVELRGNIIMGSRISGQLSDNDEVEVEGVWHAGILRAQSLVNLSMGAHLRSQSRWQDHRKGLMIAIAAIASLVIVVISAFAIFILFANNKFENTRNDNLRNWCLDIRDNGMKPPHECDGVL